MIDPDSPSHRPLDLRSVREAFLIFGGFLTLLALAAWWVVREPPRERPRFSVASESGRGTTGDYVGPRVCAECHPGESAFHGRSGHSKTLRLGAEVPLAGQLAGRTVADPESPTVSWSYDRRDGDLVAERHEAGTVEQFFLDYAFGSGHHATTFLTLVNPAAPVVLEHRLTHYSEGDALKITPGQRAAAPSPGTTPHGRRPSPSDTLKCFGCHSTRTSATGERLVVGEVIPNVSCERCHGPSRKHVEDARAGRVDLRMPFGSGGWTAESQLEFCGQCHRHPSRGTRDMIRPENTALARFQPVGISQSPCYTKSAGGLSCVTCHDPHDRASPDRAGYEKACLKCHESSSAAVCTVSPEAGCIDCHMPRVDTGQHLLFTDHWIRARRGPGLGPGSR